MAASGRLRLNGGYSREWPASRLGEGDQFVVCVLDDGTIARRLVGLTARPVHGHNVQVQTVTSSADVGECHVLFVPTASSARLPELTARHRNGGVLLMSEARDSMPGEIIITLQIVNNRLTFDVNLDAAASQGLRLSSKLLRLARHVSGASRAAQAPAERTRTDDGGSR